MSDSKKLKFPDDSQKILFSSNIPTRNFTSEKIRKLIVDDDKYCAENPKLLKWAQTFGKEKNGRSIKT